MGSGRDHGGGIDAAMALYGGQRHDWLDLSTGINPVPYLLPDIPAHAWQTLPDTAAIARLEAAAHNFWRCPEGVEVVAASGASALIAAIPALLAGREVHIPAPTYNEHAAAFRTSGWSLADTADTKVVVNPNNPDGRIWQAHELDAAQCVIDESFCDVCPQASLVDLATRPDHIVLKSFGKFWGLAGLRLGFAICLPDTAKRLREALGPWPVSGPACHIGQAALADEVWAAATRGRLEQDCAELDQILAKSGVTVMGGTSLFRLGQVADAAALHRHLARNHILCRVFPYAPDWVRFGLPGGLIDWQRLRHALGSFA